MSGLTIQTRCPGEVTALSDREIGVHVPWGIGFLGFCITLWVFHICGFEQGLRAMDSAHPTRVSDFLIATLAWRPMADIATIFGIALFCRVRYKCNVERVTRLMPFGGLRYSFPVLCGILLAGMNAAIYFAFIVDGIYEVDPLSREARAAHLFAWFLQRGLIIPIFEEFLFRGILYSWLRRHFACAPSVVVSSSLFALTHGWSGSTILHFISGAIFAVSFEKAKRLSFPIIIHGSGNLITILAWGLVSEFGR